MSDVFLSYSREDTQFVRALHARLAELGRESWVDWEGIPPTAEWMDEIRRGIEAADVFVFVLSPASVCSEVCAAESAHAAECGKRLVPVVARDVDAELVPDELRRLNWIFFTDPGAFDGAFTTLIEALQQDLDHLRVHTRILVRASQWVRRDDDPSVLLRGRDLQEAERWLADARQQEPRPTSEQTRFLLESRRAESRRQRRVQAGVSVALVVALALAALALWQRDQAEDARRVAESQRRLAVARALATQSELEAGDSGDDLVRGALLAGHSLRSAPTREGVSAWQRRMTMLPPGPSVVSADFEDASAGGFSRDGARWAIGTERGRLTVGRAEDGASLASWQAIDTPTRSLAFSPDGRWIAVGGREEMAVWELLADGGPGERVLHLQEGRIGRLGFVRALEFTRDGAQLLVAAEDYGVDRIGTDSWRLLAPLELEGTRVFSLALHPERPVVALGGYGLWLADLGTGELRAVEDARRGEIHALAFSPTGFELVAVDDGRVRMWDVEPGPAGTLQAAPADRLAEYDALVQGLAVDPTNRYVAVAGEGATVHMLWAKSGDERQRIPTHGEARAIRFADGDGRLMTLSRRFEIWQTASREALSRRRFKGRLSQAFLVGAGRWVVAAPGEGPLHLLDVDGLEPVRTEPLGRVVRLALSPDRRLLAAAGSEVLVVLDATTLSEVWRRTFEPPARHVALRFSTDSKHLAVTSSRWAAVLDLDAKAWLTLVEASSSRPLFSVDGRWLRIRNGSAVQLADMGSGRVLPPLEGRLRSLDEANDRACTTTEAIRGQRGSRRWIWRIEDAELLAYGPDPEGIAVVHRDDREPERTGDQALVAACADWPRVTWDETPAPEPMQSDRHRLERHDAVLRLLAREPDDMIAELCRRVPRGLSEAEWCQILPEQPYTPLCEGPKAAVNFSCPRTPTPRKGT